ALCVLAILFGTPILKWFFELRFLRWIGMLSSSLYIWHLNILVFFASVILPHLPVLGTSSAFVKDIVLWLFVGVIIIPFAFLFYKAVEEPGIRLGAYLTNKKFRLAPLTGKVKEASPVEPVKETSPHESFTR